MEQKKIFILTDKKDELYDSFILKLGQAGSKSSFSIAEIDYVDYKADQSEDFVVAPGIFLLYSLDNEWIEKTVKIVRKSNETALAPIIILSDIYNDEDNLSDSVIKTSELDKIPEYEIEKYFYMADEINTFTYVAEETNVSRKKLLILLRFLVSRGKKILEPKKSQAHPFNSYPLAEALLVVNSEEAIERLELLNNMKLLNKVMPDNKYYLTSDGVKAAESGILCDFSKRESVLKGENNLVKNEVFKEILYLENIRSIRFETDFCLAQVEFKGTDYSEFISGELYKILIGSLRATDLYVQLEPGVFLILFLNCGVTEVNLALKKIKNEVKSILQDQIKISWKIVSKSGERSQGALFENKIMPPSLDEVGLRGAGTFEGEKLQAAPGRGPLQSDETLQSVTLPGMPLKGETLKEKKPSIKTATKNLGIDRLVVKSISAKSIFNFFFFLYLIIFVVGVILYISIYYLGKKFGFISAEFQISLFIYGTIDRIGLNFLNYFNNPIISTILSCAVGLAFSIVSGFLGFLLACITNLGLKISKGIELRFLKNKSKE